MQINKMAEIGAFLGNIECSFRDVVMRSHNELLRIQWLPFFTHSPPHRNVILDFLRSSAVEII